MRDGDKLEPVFIHSSFRTGSTWLWSKFRKDPACYCYYEVFNEMLSGMDFRNILQSPTDWNSHHPSGAPYFSEFSPLLRKHGVAGFDEDMATAEFFLDAGSDVGRVRRTDRYLNSLVGLAQQNRRVPILSCTRSIGRIGLIKSLIGGSHILIRRRLLNQWFSYSNQALNKNSFFFNTIIRTANTLYADSFMSMIRDLLQENDIKEDQFGTDHDTLLIAFLCLHIYLYAKYENEFDVVIDLQKGSSDADLEKASASIADITNINISLSDYKENITAPFKLIQDIDRVFIMVRSLFAKGVSGVDNASLIDFVNRELADFQEGYAQYRRVAGSAHVQLEAYAAASSPLREDHKAAADELAAIRLSTQQQIDDLSFRLKTATSDLESTARQLEDAHRTMQQERQAFDEQGCQAAVRLQEVEAALNQAREDRDALESDIARHAQAQMSADCAMQAAGEHQAALQQDLQQAAMRETDLKIRLGTASSDLEGTTRQLEDAHRTMQQERQAFDEQGRQAAARLQEVEAVLDQTREDRDALQQEVAQREEARIASDSAMQVAGERQATLERDLHQAAVREADLTRRLEMTASDLENMARQLEDAHRTVQQKRQAFDEQDRQAAARLQEMEAALGQTREGRDALQQDVTRHEEARVSAESAVQAAAKRQAALEHDLRQAAMREADLNTRLEAAAVNLADATRQLEDAHQARQQERAQKELVEAELQFMTTDNLKEDEDLTRRWDAMIKKIR